MRKSLLRCGSCQGTLAVPNTPGSGQLECPICRTTSQAWIFPAFFREKPASAGQRVVDDGQASCMNHPEKQAVAVCDGCGKFLCALCDVDWGSEHLCPSCIEHRNRADYGGAHRTRYTHYDTVALGIVVLSLPLMFLFFIGGLIAPIAIYIAWRYWREPWRPAPYGKAGMIIAVLLANLVFIAWLGFIAFFVVNI